jgi:hypothetical protein
MQSIIRHSKGHPVAYAICISCHDELSFLLRSAVTFMETGLTVVAVYKYHAIKAKKTSGNKILHFYNPSNPSGKYIYTTTLTYQISAFCPQSVFACSISFSQ